MAVSSPALRGALVEVLGRDGLLEAPAALAAHAVDGVAPRWVARPGSVEEVSGLLALASAERLAVAPRGSGSSLGLGNPPARLDLVLDLGRLAALAAHVPEDMVASVEAGLTLEALGARLAAHGQMLALDPIGGASRTVGGVLACQASGPLRFRYGTGRDLLLGVRFVQADGTITWGGARVVKSVSGYDVPKLMVGSLGTLGVIVEGTLRLHPLPEASASWLLSADSPEVITDCLAALLDTALEPDRVVALNRAAAPGLEAAGRGPMLLVSFGSVAEAVASQGAALERLAAGHRARAGMAPEGVWSSLAHGHDGALRMRLACEPARLMAWLAQVERLASGLGLEAACLGQGGQGVLEVALRGAMPPADLGPGLVLPLREGLAPEGGSLVLEAAPAHLKAGLDAWGAISPEVQELFSRLKREFDPLGILNPGRFVGGL